MPGVVLLAPVAAILAGILYLVLRRWRVVPRGKAGIPGFLLLGCSLYVPLFLHTTTDLVLAKPANLQKQHLGRQYGSASELREFSYWAFQDYTADWYYDIDSRDAAELHKRCLTIDARLVDKRHAHECHLFHNWDNDERSVSIILDNNRLHIQDWGD
jgi:hypothetical protein